MAIVGLDEFCKSIVVNGTADNQVMCSTVTGLNSMDIGFGFREFVSDVQFFAVRIENQPSVFNF